MNWHHEQVVKGGRVAPIKEAECIISFDEERETDHIPKKQLEAAKKAAVAAVTGVSGDVLLTVSGGREAGDAPQPERLEIVVTRQL